MIGRNSICVKFTIKKKPVVIQANKNYAICDIIFSHDAVEPKKPIELTKESMAKYRKEKLSYDLAVREIKNQRQAFLNKFQGKQLNDAYIVERINYYLNETAI